MQDFWNKIKDGVIIAAGFAIAVLYAMVGMQRRRANQAEQQNQELQDKETHDKNVQDVSKQSDQAVADDLNKLTDRKPGDS